jgi:hypothetical protein
MDINDTHSKVKLNDLVLRGCETYNGYSSYQNFILKDILSAYSQNYAQRYHPVAYAGESAPRIPFGNNGATIDFTIPQLEKANDEIKVLKKELSALKEQLAIYEEKGRLEQEEKEHQKTEELMGDSTKKELSVLSRWLRSGGGFLWKSVERPCGARTLMES